MSNFRVQLVLIYLCMTLCADIRCLKLSRQSFNKNNALQNAILGAVSNKTNCDKISRFCAENL